MRLRCVVLLSDGQSFIRLTELRGFAVTITNRNLVQECEKLADQVFDSVKRQAITEDVAHAALWKVVALLAGKAISETKRLGTMVAAENNIAFLEEAMRQKLGEDNNED